MRCSGAAALLGGAPVFAVEMVPGHVRQRTEHRSFLSRKAPERTESPATDAQTRLTTSGAKLRCPYAGSAAAIQQLHTDSFRDPVIR